MSYRVISGTASAASAPSPGIRPTVVIGLGGTGGDILLKLRKKIFERYGPPHDFPVLQYVYVDTDTSNKDIDSSLLQEFDFNKAERIDAIVEETTKYTRHLDQHPLIKSWWYPTTQDMGSMTVGAGQIRSYSRLGFYVNFDKIETAVTLALQAAGASSDTMFKRWGIRPETSAGTNVYIVTSLAGGTGGGMFLDTAFMCKNLLAGVGNQIVGFLVMPGIFLATVDRLFANGYSALKELEHYSYPTNGFNYEWREGYPPRSRRPLPPPPFSYTYLIDSTNFVRNRVDFANRHTLFEMVANSIFQDFGSSDFAARKRSTRVNLDQYLTGFYAADILDPRDPNEKLLSEVFTMNHSAFGLASIQYPADRIKRALGAKLAADIVRRLAQGEEQKGEFSKWVQEQFFKGGYEETRFDFFVGDIALSDGRVQRRHDLLDRLYRSATPGQTIKSVIDERVDQFQTNAQNGAYKHTGIPLSQYLLSQEEQILAYLSDDPKNAPDKWGDWCKWLRRNKQDFLEEELLGSTDALGQRKPPYLEAAVSQFVNKPTLGIAFARALLREISTILKQRTCPYLPLLNQETQDLTARVQEYSREYKRVWGEIRRRESETGLVKMLFGSADTEQLVKNYMDNFRRYLDAVISLKARHEAIDICEQTLQVIGEEGVIEEKTGQRVGQTGMLRSLLQLEESLDRLASDFDRIQREYSREDDDQNTLYIYEESDLETQYYPRYMGHTPAEVRDNLSQRAQELLDSLPAVGNAMRMGVRVMELPDFVASNGSAQATKLMLKYCDSVFKTLQDDFEVLDMFFAKYSDPSSRLQQLSMIFAKSQMWIEGSAQSGYQMPLPNRQLIVGCYRGKNFNELETEIKTRVRGNQDPPIVFEEIKAKNEIVFYSEGAGYPLCYSKAVHDMKIKYERMAFDDLINLHADKNEYKFKDLLEMSESDRNDLETATRTYLLGVILDIIKSAADEDGEVVYKVIQKIGMTASEWAIGTRHRVVGVLHRKPALRAQVDSLIRDREAALNASPDGWAKYYAVVSYYQDKLFPALSTTAVSKEYKLQATTENLVLRTKIREIEAAAADLTNLETLAKPVYDNLQASVADNAVTPLAEGMVSIRHAWPKVAEVRL